MTNEEEAEAEAEQLSWEAQVDEAVAVVSIAGEEAAALLARKKKEEGGNDENENESSDFFGAVDVGDESQISALREAGFGAAGPLQLRLLVEVEIAEGGSGEEEGGIGLSLGAAAAAAASVSSLQPLRLAVALPRCYLMPSISSREGDEGGARVPAVSVSAPWLSAKAAAGLEARLRSLAEERLREQEEQEPVPVVFELVELAKESALAEALSGTDGGRSLDLLEIVGGGGEEGGNDDDAADDGGGDNGEPGPSAAALSLLRQLLSDDAAMRRDRFRRGSHACCICLEEVSGARATALPCCSKEKKKDERKPRAACNDCLSALAASALRNKDASSLVCPFPDCRQPLPPALLSSLLTEEQAEEAERLRLERALAQMGALRCPHCDFAAVVADAQGCCLCPSCRFSFCSSCFDSWHGGRECTSPEARLALARARRARSSSESGIEGAGAGDRASALALRRAEEEFLSLAAISRSGFKACPACRTPIERTAGCNRMRCAACSTSFCFVCSAVVEEGYSHFGQGRCRLLSAEEIARWEREERGGAEAAAADRNAFWLGLARQQQEQQRGGGGGGGNANIPLLREIKISRCPSCGARHAGESNDRKCGNCKTRHCGSCGEVLRKGVLHFGRPPKCREHAGAFRRGDV